MATEPSGLDLAAIKAAWNSVHNPLVLSPDARKFYYHIERLISAVEWLQHELCNCAMLDTRTGETVRCQTCGHRMLIEHNAANDDGAEWKQAICPRCLCVRIQSLEILRGTLTGVINELLNEGRKLRERLEVYGGECRELENDVVELNEQLDEIELNQAMQEGETGE